MHKLDQDTLLAIGRMTVAAADVEHALAWIAAGEDGSDPPALFARPGEPLLAARRWAASAPHDLRGEHVGLVEGAGTQLARSQAALRSLWQNDGPPVPATFDEISMLLVRVRDALTAMVS